MATMTIVLDTQKDWLLYEALVRAMNTSDTAAGEDYGKSVPQQVRDAYAKANGLRTPTRNVPESVAPQLNTDSPTPHMDLKEAQAEARDERTTAYRTTVDVNKGGFPPIPIEMVVDYVPPAMNLAEAKRRVRRTKAQIEADNVQIEAAKVEMVRTSTLDADTAFVTGDEVVVDTSGTFLPGDEVVAMPLHGMAYSKPAVIEEDFLPAEEFTATAPAATDAELGQALSRVNGKLKDRPRIEKMIGDFVETGKSYTQIPASRRAEFLAQLDTLV